MKFLNNLDLNKNEIQNFRVQNLASAPSNPVVGQHYYDTAEGTEFVWSGTKWIDALSQGDYTFRYGIEEVEGRNVQIKLATGNNAGDIAFVANENGLKADVDLTGYAKASEAADLAGTDSIKAALGKLEAKADEKVVANEAITGATKTKITYDAKGLVTAGADLSEADIPELHLAKVTDVTATATEVNVLDGIEVTTTELNQLDGVTGNVQNQLDDKVAKNDAITAGTKTKITYDAKGLVTGGADLSEADIPTLDGAKIGSLATYEKANTKAAIATDDTLPQALGKLEYKADNAIVANPDIEAGTHTKITYDAKGLVTAGADLSEADIPEIHLAKITDVTATAAEVNILDGATLTTTELNYVDGVTSSIQDQLDAKVDENAAIEADTKCKITYDAKGLVTGGADLSEADIPTLGAAKIGNLTGYAKASEIAALAEGDTALTAFGKIQASLDNKIALTALSIESESTDYLTYDATTGEFGAKVSTTIANDDTNLVTGDAVYEAIKDDITLTDLSIEDGSADFLTYDNTTGEIGAKAGVANGLATLDANGTVPAEQLPSYVDDVLNLVAISATAPATASEGDLYFNTGDKKIYTYKNNAWGSAADPETGKIYINLENEMSYRWSGTALVQIGADKLLGFNGTIEGDGTTTNFTINHGLGTRNVVFEIYEASSPYEKVYVQVLHTSTTALNVVFGTAPAVGENYTITVIAIG